MTIKMGATRRGAMLALLALMPSVLAAQTYTVRRIYTGRPKGYEDVHIAKAAVPGERIRLWWATMVNPDCTAAGTITTDVLTPPRHGDAVLSDDPFYPNFLPPNPRVACDELKVPGKQLFYTAAAGFKGHDKMVFRSATTEGRIRRVIVDIDVR
jgi:hypothetical protein